MIDKALAGLFKAVSDEAASNPAFARKLEESLAKFAEDYVETRAAERRVGDFHPFIEYRKGTPDEFRARLSRFDVKELKLVIGKYNLDSASVLKGKGAKKALVEHILASHPEVEGANEIPDLPQVIEDESRRRSQPFPQWVAAATSADWHRLGQDYLSRTARWREQRPRFTDKNVANWPLLGAARLMLPGARIIHCHRDPVETCFSCYRHLFRHGVHCSYDLDELADYYSDYERLSALWLARHPQYVLDFPYETLLLEPEAQIRRLLAFCNLPFDPACLTPHQTRREVLSTASAAQVRQPIRRDKAHSILYRDWLQPLRDHLAR